MGKQKQHHKGKHKKKGDFQKLKAKYRASYLSWKSVFCPAFGADVLFTNDGWLHISNETKKRTFAETERRLNLLPLARNLLSKTITVQGKRFQNHQDHFEFVALEGGIKIGVIVKEYKKQFTFYSVYKV